MIDMQLIQRTEKNPVTRLPRWTNLDLSSLFRTSEVLHTDLRGTGQPVTVLRAVAVTIVPFSYLFCQNMMGKLGKMSEKKMERLVGTLARGNENCAQILGIDHH